MYDNKHDTRLTADTIKITDLPLFPNNVPGYIYLNGKRIVKFLSRKKSKTKQKPEKKNYRPISGIDLLTLPIIQDP